jgi:hypothetical protein
VARVRHYAVAHPSRPGRPGGSFAGRVW